MQFSKQQLIGFAGAILLLIGVFLPVISIPIMGSVSLFNNGKSDGLIILVLSIISVALIFINKIRLLLVTGLFSLAIVAYDFYQVSRRLSTLKEELSQKMAGNMFGGFAEAMAKTIQLQYGWVILGIGCVLLIITPFISRQDEEQEYKKVRDVRSNATKLVANDIYTYHSGQSSEVNENINQQKTCPYCRELIKIDAIKCKHCGSMIENDV